MKKEDWGGWESSGNRFVGFTKLALMGRNTGDGTHIVR